MSFRKSVRYLLKLWQVRVAALPLLPTVGWQCDGGMLQPAL